MTWSVVAHTVGISFPTTAVNTTGADLIVVLATADDTAGAPPTPTDNQSNTYTQAIQAGVGNGRCVTTMWYKHNPTTNSSHTFSTTAAASSLIAIAVSGSVVGTVLDQTHGQNVNGDGSTLTQQPGSITPGQAGEFIVAGYGVDDPVDSGGTPFSVDSGFTISDSQDVVVGQTFGLVAAYLKQGSAAAVNPTMTRSNAMLVGRAAGMIIASFFGSSFTWLEMDRRDDPILRKYRMVAY